MHDRLRFSWKITLLLAASLVLLPVILVFVSPVATAIASIPTFSIIADYLTDAFNGPAYYISTEGNDSGSGRTPFQAWRSIERVNQNDFEPGSHIRFLGGQTFEGNLVLDETDCGSGLAEAPTVINSYGEGQATIAAGVGHGILIQNCDHVRVAQLVVEGNGSGNTENGVEIVNNMPGDTLLSGIEVDGLEVSGFRHGIHLRAANGLSGFSQVRLINNQTHHNLHSGISTNWDTFDNTVEGWPFKDIYVAQNVAHNNAGDPTYTEGHSGNGIVIGSVEDALIEHNFVYDNGAANAAPYQGPVGLWAWDCKSTTIQFNESFSNKSGTNSDGGGFDLDGGCQDSVMQYNFSHDNEGAGFMAGQFEGAREMRNITLRYNLSVNDARRNRYSGIYLFRVAGAEMKGIDIYQNTVFISPGSNQPAAFRISNWTTGLEDIKVINNSFITSGGAWLVDIEQPGNNISFWGNNYDSSEETFVIRYEGDAYYSLPEWREESSQERLNGTETGTALSASVNNPGGSSPFDYQLRSGSSLVDGGLSLVDSFVQDAGNHDFFGNPVPANITYDIGMYEEP
jgi:hypothetical protein